MLGGTSAAMVEAAAMSAAMKGAPHRAAERAADHRNIRGGRAGHLGKEHAEHRDDLREPAANVSHQREREVRHPLHHVRRAHQLADQQKERDGEQRLVVHAVEHLLDDGAVRDVGEHRTDEGADEERECDRHAHVTEE
jgi:hypothetical protein